MLNDLLFCSQHTLVRRKEYLGSDQKCKITHNSVTSMFPQKLLNLILFDIKIKYSFKEELHL